MPESDKRRCLMIGAGGMAGAWIRHFFPSFRDRMEIVGLVDLRPQVLADQSDFLGLDKSRRFTEMEEAFERIEADFCTIVIPPAHHRRAALLAAERGLDILSEKPIADSWDDCLDIVRAVEKAGVKMQVVQNYRFTPRILTVKRVIDEGRIGRPNYLVSRFAADYRVRGSWGAAFRHEIAHSLLIEGSVHHFDQLRNLAGADCRMIAGWDWNPPNDSFDGESCAAYVMRMTNDVVAHYEGNCLEAGHQNSWHGEYYRVEGDEGAVLVDADDRVLLLRHTPGEGVETEEVPPVAVEWEGHRAIIAQFLDWLDGGPEPPTSLRDNIKSAAMLFAAIEASETGRTVDVVAKLADAGITG